MDEFLKKYRPLLPGSNRHAGIWASDDGRPMTGNSLYLAIKRLVHRRTGKLITLHDLRRIAATSLALYDPENVAAASDLLGHRKSETTQRHYNRASSIVAARSMAEIIGKIRQRRPP
jgi:integrase